MVATWRRSGHGARPGHRDRRGFRRDAQAGGIEGRPGINISGEFMKLLPLSSRRPGTNELQDSIAAVYTAPPWNGNTRFGANHQFQVLTRRDGNREDANSQVSGAVSPLTPGAIPRVRAD